VPGDVPSHLQNRHRGRVQYMYPLYTTQPVYMRLHYVATYEPKGGYLLIEASTRRVPTNLVRARISLMGCQDVWAAFWVCFAQTHARTSAFLLE